MSKVGAQGREELRVFVARVFFLFFWFRMSQRAIELELLFLDFIDANGYEKVDFHLCDVILFIFEILVQGFQGVQLEIMEAGHACFDL